MRTPRSRARAWLCVASSDDAATRSCLPLWDDGCNVALCARTDEMISSARRA
jgi:hypothetical protein